MEILRELKQLQFDRGHLDTSTLRELSERKRIPLYRLEGLVSFYPSFRTTRPPKAVVSVCRDITCAMAGSKSCHKQLLDHLGDRDDVEVHAVSCLGRCDAAPAATINNVPVSPLTLSDLSQVLAIIDDRPELSPDKPSRSMREWQCDPYKDGNSHYSTVKTLIASGKDVRRVCIQRLTDSQLRGMGGAGFPAGRKWELVTQEPAKQKYVICNADESEPGTFKDRIILEELPHLIIEGMLLGGLTTGAEHGIIFLRHEYVSEQRAMESAIDEARRLGVLGPNAAGSGQSFDIEIFVSPGGYILGEETALLEALEDRRGEPRNKPPYPGTHGLWGKPTLINNVETLALATSIIYYGSTWWHAQGRGTFSGLKFISISGDVVKPGVHEIPMGTTVAEVIERAGGIKGSQSLKAFLPGGPSSNFLTAQHCQTPLDFEAMKQAGSMLGTGAVIVIAERHDLFALATNLVQFFRNESCGKCVPCRIGSEKAVHVLERVLARNMVSSELGMLSELRETMEQTSICGLGQVALNPICSMMKYFPEEVPE